MSDVVIRAENLSKRYAIGQIQRHGLLRDVLADAARAPFRALRSNHNGRNGSGDDFIWALKDVSFEVRQGEIVGIIGRNGAGKSTLLKILSRITEPTSGHAEIRGRIGSLLEVGTGFHPELTGRENAFLNGAILGMRKQEIARKFDEIVAFAEVEKFIDTPVKHYSSGMYVRLAFAVAAHLDTEVLFVDEVLAVGDVQFQKKCLGKMDDVARHGRTVLLVSHNMASIEALCSRSIFMQQGHDVQDGDTREVIRRYLTGCDQQMNAASVDLRSDSIPRAGKSTIFSRVEIKNGTGEATTSFVPGDDLVFNFSLDPPVAIRKPALHVGFDDAMGRRIFSIGTPWSVISLPEIHRPTTVRCIVRDLRLVPGRYSISICIGTEYEPWMDAILNAAFFDVEASDYFGSGKVPSSDIGLVLIPSEWQVCTYADAEA